MSLVTLRRKIAILGDHAVIVMANGDHHQAVCISRDALPGASAEATNSLAECLDLFEHIADGKLAEGHLLLMAAFGSCHLS